MAHVTPTATKKRFVSSYSQVYYYNLHNTLIADFQSGAVRFKVALPWSSTKPQIFTLFYLARLVSVTSKQKLQTSGISSRTANAWKLPQKSELNR